MKIQLITYLFALILTGALSQAADRPESKANCADGLIGHYFATQEALAADDLETSKAAARQLLAAHEKNPCAKVLGKSTQSILDAQSIKEARAAFKILSDTLIPIVEESGVSSTEAHLVHCPMAFEFTGASWLQKDKSVANPYFGSKMFTCGAVKQSFGQDEKSQVRQDYGQVKQSRDK